ncbi:MAG: hypothetical protein K1X74_23270 [Pirellulales bacterium]|nr:hypothetical protein [Pirellulales bacterium]
MGVRIKTLKLSESGFTAQVLAYAKAMGWRTAHFRPAQTAKGWRTAVQGDGKGFPDLILVRERVVVAELKVGCNVPSLEQLAWLEAFAGAGVESYTWRPADWASIEKVLRSSSP